MRVLLDVWSGVWALVFLTMGLRLAISPRGCAGTVRHRSLRRAPAGPCTVLDLTDVDPGRSRTPATEHPIDQLSTATSTARFVTHTHTGGIS